MLMNYIIIMSHTGTMKHYVFYTLNYIYLIFHHQLENGVILPSLCNATPIHRKGCRPISIRSTWKLYLFYICLKGVYTWSINVVILAMCWVPPPPGEGQQAWVSNNVLGAPPPGESQQAWVSNNVLSAPPPGRRSASMGVKQCGSIVIARLSPRIRRHGLVKTAWAIHGQRVTDRASSR